MQVQIYINIHKYDDAEQELLVASITAIVDAARKA
jgi:hypothetical protein